MSVLRTWAADANIRYTHSSLPSPLRFITFADVAIARSQVKATGTRQSSGMHT